MKHKLTKELCIFGKYGQLYEKGLKTVGIIIYGTALRANNLKRILGLQPISAPLSDEHAFSADIEFLNKITEFIKVPLRHGVQRRFIPEWT